MAWGPLLRGAQAMRGTQMPQTAVRAQEVYPRQQRGPYCPPSSKAARRHSGLVMPNAGASLYFHGRRGSNMSRLGFHVSPAAYPGRAWAMTTTRRGT
jgi:hypothetical protein